MTLNEYQELALRTARPDLTNLERLEEALMGLNGEAGEAIDILKKHLYHDHDLDRKHLALELGDITWYIQLACQALGYSFEDICKMNVEKLRKRYPYGFDSEHSIHRGANDI